jgi:SAM-dependent methyltransferase
VTNCVEWHDDYERPASSLARRLKVVRLRLSQALGALGYPATLPVACFSVLHHIAATEDQDRLFAELRRVLRPGGIFVGQESLDLEMIRAGHADDVFMPVDPDGLADRLSAVGFGPTKTDVVGFHYRFISRKPA